MKEKSERGFEVEWISSRGKQELNDFNPDACVYSYKDFRTLAAAKAFAKKVESPQVNAAWIQEFVLVEECDGLQKDYLDNRIEVECIFKP